MLVPVSSFSPSILEIKPIDVTQDFIQDCGQHNFYLKESSSKFCLRSAFTITSRFNNGALACDCDRLGSTQTTCQSFGGQCACRPNVIGRTCDRCKSGYSGFPHCRKLVSWWLGITRRFGFQSQVSMITEKSYCAKRFLPHHVNRFTIA